jgi:ribosomal-protein-alanine N-acetyltransferase
MTGLSGASSPIRVAEMSPGDLPEVLEIEKASHVEPWDERFFREEFERPHSRLLVALKQATEVAGYICFWMVADEVQIFNLAVAPAERRRGVGRSLLLEALKIACRNKARLALLEVRRGNTAARHLYESVGFRPAGIRPGYYSVGREAAVLMELEMDRAWRSRWFAGSDPDPTEGVSWSLRHP